MGKYSWVVFAVLLIIGVSGMAPGKTNAQMVQQEARVETSVGGTVKPGESSAYVSGITGGRARSLVAGVLGLASIVIGWRAKARSAKSGGKLALMLGLIAIVLGVDHLAASGNAVFGSGSGKAGAIVAVILGLIGMILGGLALRVRRAD